MNGFSQTEDYPIKITGMMLQSLFPPINIAKEKINNLKRVVHNLF